MAAYWKWSESRVRRYLDRLKADAMIDARTDAGVTVVTICKYDDFQHPLSDTDALDDAEGDAQPTQGRRSTDAQNKESKKGRREEGIIGDAARKRATRIAGDWMTVATGGEMFSGATHSETATTRVRDYPAIIDRLTARIAQLEMQKRELAAKDRDIRLKDQALEKGDLEKTILAAQARDADKGDGVTGFTFTVKRLTAEGQADQ
jgi:hypothetical protein